MNQSNIEIIAQNGDEEDSDTILSTNLPAKSIKAIDKTTVHRICSGQVVLTLATAIKELVENSVDAGSTSIEIRLKEYGSSFIEVSDNGKGVEPMDFEGLTLKHHTSKLQDFGDLVGVKTFGFRGEALSSLCALSNLTIVTRHLSQPVGTKLIYDTKGHLTEQAPTSRQIGTTVTLQDLFYTLPVRHKEFQRNLKKEFSKMVHVLYAYCLITTKVRILCTNQTGKNSKTTVVSTESHSSLKENISSIFGHKQVSTIMEISQKKPSDEVLAEYGMSNAYDESSFELEGFISSCEHGKGRSAADRQFYFINNRPCDPAKITRVVNEVYHHYNKHQFPMVVLNIRMKDDDVDINVTPDKRQIMVSKEKLLLATVKATLIGLYESIPSTFNISQLQSFSSPFSQKSTAKIVSVSPKISALSERFACNSPLSISQSPLNGAKSKTPASFGAIKRSLSEQSDLQSSAKQTKLQDFLFKSTTLQLSSVLNEESIDETTEDKENSIINNEHNVEEIATSNNFPKGDLTYTENSSKDLETECNVYKENGSIYVPTIMPLPQRTINVNLDFNLNNDSPGNRPKLIHTRTDEFLSNLKARKSMTNGSTQAVSFNSRLNEVNEVSSGRSCDDKNTITDRSNKSKDVWNESSFERLSPIILYDDNDHIRKSNGLKRFASKAVTVPFNLKRTGQNLALKKKNKSKNGNFYRKFRAQIAPTDNQTAEEELKKEINKESFTKMDLIGQFNLGFIIARLESDLFIIDQHATDEKYNFETLQKTCVLQNQKLIIPQPLELTPANEMILLDNMEIFTKNGFEFRVDNSKCVGSRVMLTSMPHSKGWEFKKEDIEEMIFMLSDSPGVMCRPSRISAMFASRSCRKSVMIGTSLSMSQMRKLVDHMSEIEHPWNCPHGRPTFRHLINLDMIAKSS